MSDKTNQPASRFKATGFFVFAWVAWLFIEELAVYFIKGPKMGATEYYLLSLVMELLLIIPAVVFMLIKRIRLFSLFGRADAGQIAAGATLGMLTVPVSIAFSLIWGFFISLTGGNIYGTGAATTPQTALQYLIAFACAGIAAPLVEEPTTRGLVLGGQASVFSGRKAIFFTALLFALMHGRFVGFPSLLLGGVVLTLLAWRSGSLWPSIAFHFTYNTATIILQPLAKAMSQNAQKMPGTHPVQIPDLLTLAYAAVMWVFMSLPFIAAGAAVLWAFWKFTPRAIRPMPDPAIKIRFSSSWPWLLAFFLLLCYVAIDILRVYGIIGVINK